MLASIALAAFATAGIAWLGALAVREHRAAIAARAGLLDALLPHFTQVKVEVAPDGFPTLTGRLPDRREVFIELIPDTLVVRRLPQLWLCVTLRERVERPRASIGALARPTGAEFYSRVHDFPERIDAPAGVESECLMRGDGRLAASELGRIGAVLRGILADPHIKEIAATPRGVRIIRQAAEGERGAHLLLRQIRFGASASHDTVARCIAKADLLRDALDQCAQRQTKLSA
jgi:hypothetical protein